jgi:hypothetical protein
VADQQFEIVIQHFHSARWHPHLANMYFALDIGKYFWPQEGQKFRKYHIAQTTIQQRDNNNNVINL